MGGSTGAGAVLFVSPPGKFGPGPKGFSPISVLFVSVVAVPDPPLPGSVGFGVLLPPFSSPDPLAPLFFVYFLFGEVSGWLKKYSYPK